MGYTYTDAQLEADAVAADGAYLVGYKGDRLPGAPEHRFNASAGYGIPLANGLLTIRGDIYHQSDMRNALSLSPRFDVDLDAYTIVNASMTYSRSAWDTTLWIKNIGNTDAVNGVYTELYMGTSPAQNYYGNGSKALVTLPRTIGVTVSYRF